MGRRARCGVIAVAVAAAVTLAPPLEAVAASRAAAPSTCGVTAGASWRMVSTSSVCRLVVPVGVAVPVRLSAGFRWSTPTSTSLAVSLRAVHPVSGGLRGTLRASRVVVATLSATGRVRCTPGEPCAALVLLWRLRVYVVAHAASPARVVVSGADDGATLSLRRGDRLVVALAGPSMYTWSAPRADDPTLLARSGASAGHATFTVHRAGRTGVSAVDTPNCYPQCLAASRLWRVRVVAGR